MRRVWPTRPLAKLPPDCKELVDYNLNPPQSLVLNLLGQAAYSWLMYGVVGKAQFCLRNVGYSTSLPIQCFVEKNLEAAGELYKIKCRAPVGELFLSREVDYPYDLVEGNVMTI